MPAKTLKGPETRGRPTLYKGVQMRSRLEADYAGHLDRRGLFWEYEPVCFGGEDGQWLPDFRGRRPDSAPSESWLIELKPVSLLGSRESESEWDVIDRIDKILTQASIAWLSEPDVAINLVFWAYRASEADFKIVARGGSPWRTASKGVPIMSLWPGMGQFDRLESITQDAAGDPR